MRWALCAPITGGRCWFVFVTRCSGTARRRKTPRTSCRVFSRTCQQARFGTDGSGDRAGVGKCCRRGRGCSGPPAGREAAEAAYQEACSAAKRAEEAQQALAAKLAASQQGSPEYSTTAQAAAAAIERAQKARERVSLASKAFETAIRSLKNSSIFASVGGSSSRERIP